MSKDDIIRMAFELGLALADSEEMRNYRETQTMVISDAEAYGLIMRYQEAREKATQKLRETGRLEVEDEQSLRNLEQSMRENPLVKNMLEQRQKVDNLMDAVYFSIEQAMNSPACSGSGCDSCGGSCG